MEDPRRGQAENNGEKLSETVLSLTGLTGNLRFGRLHLLNSQFSQALKQNEKPRAEELFSELQKEYGALGTAIMEELRAE